MKNRWVNFNSIAISSHEHEKSKNILKNDEEYESFCFFF